MKKIRKYLCGCLSALAAFALISCGGGGGTPQAKSYTVSFETSGGSAVASQTVEEGGYATRPEDPTKASNYFAGWFKESTCENGFDFASEAINADTTVYASWVDSTTATAAKFYTSDTEFITVYFKTGGRISAPADPTKTGYEFAGWYTSTAYETTFSSMKKYSEEVAFYAKWVKVFVLEAEDTQLTSLEWSYATDDIVTQSGNKKGVNWSGNDSGKNLIRPDADASGGKFVWGALNLQDGYLDFEFNADKADDNASLYMTVCAEFWGYVLSDDMFSVIVNPGTDNEQELSYEDIDLTFVQSSTSPNSDPLWKSYFVNNMKIVQGKNVIRLLVTNDTAYGTGTITAQGPIVDCITIKTTSTIEMIKY